MTLRRRAETDTAPTSRPGSRCVALLANRPRGDASAAEPAALCSFSVGPEVIGKRLELLAEARPRFSRFAVLVDSTFWLERTSVYSSLETTARARGMAMQMVEVREAGALATTFATLVKDHTEALLIGCGPINFALRGQIAEVALRHRLPTAYSWREDPEAGGLLSYAPNLSARWSYAAVYVDKILKCAKPADLPVEQPRNLSWRSTSRPPRRLASPSRRRSC